MISYRNKFPHAFNFSFNSCILLLQHLLAAKSQRELVVFFVDSKSQRKLVVVLVDAESQIKLVMVLVNTDSQRKLVVVFVNIESQRKLVMVLVNTDSQRKLVVVFCRRCRLSHNWISGLPNECGDVYAYHYCKDPNARANTMNECN